MRLIDGDELLERAGRERLDSRELIEAMIQNARAYHAEIVIDIGEIRAMLASKYGLTIDKIHFKEDALNGKIPGFVLSV